MSYLQYFFGPARALRRGQKLNIINIIINIQLQSQFQRFLYQTLLLILLNKIYKTYRRGVSIFAESCPRGGTWGAGGVVRAFFSEYGHVAYQNEGGDE